MIVPIRCFSCGKPIGALYEQYKQRVAKGETPEKVLDDLKVRKYCCRKMLLTHAELIDEIMVFNK